MKTKERKPIVYCGVCDSDNNPVKMSKKEQANFIKMMSDGGKKEVIFCEDDLIPKTMSVIAALEAK